MVTVYVWKPGFAYLTSKGHASMLVAGGIPPGDTYISWWPGVTGGDRLSRTVERVQAVSSGVRRALHRNLQDDMLSTAEGRPPDFRIPIDGLDDTRIKSFWQRWRQEGHYQGFLFSCATTVGEALKEGGGDKMAPGWISPTVWTPMDVAHYAHRIQGVFAARRSA
jgi:hypothetical protein